MLYRRAVGVLLLLVCFLPTALRGQTKMQTLHYDKNGRQAAVPEWATYKRMMVIPTESNSTKAFRDFYTSGELLREGEYVEIDPNDDSRSVFDGEVIEYYKSGKEKSKSKWQNGALEGERVSFYEDGEVSCREKYVAGKLEGERLVYAAGGESWEVWRYAAGKPVADYYEVHSKDGSVVKYRISDGAPMLEQPQVAYRKEEHQQGKRFQVYRMNGLELEASLDRVSKFEDCYRVTLYIKNNTGRELDFQPGGLRAELIDRKGRQVQLTTFDPVEYAQRVESSAKLSTSMTGLFASLEAVNEGLDELADSYKAPQPTSTTVAVTSDGEAVVVASYDTKSEEKKKAEKEQRQAARVKEVEEKSKVYQQEAEKGKEGLLYRTTMRPGDEQQGYIMIARKRGRSLTAYLPVGGMEYRFDWDVENMQAVE